MRFRLSGGHVDSPLLCYVGRLGHEKRLMRLKIVLDNNPGSRLALIGTGPADAELREFFALSPVYFAGQLIGKV